MAITQRFENYGGQHPRITFAAGLTAGAAVVTGVVLAVAVTIGSGQNVESRVAPASVTTNEQAFAAEQDYRAAHGITERFPSVASVSDEQTFGAEQEFRASHGVTDGALSTRSISDEQAFAVEQDHRAAIGVTGTRAATAGAGVETELRAGMEDLVAGHRSISLSPTETSSALTPELGAGMDDSVAGHRFATRRPAVGDSVLTPEMAAGMDDIVPGHVPAWMTSELRAGIEG